MKNIYIYCEGQTEESFINNVLCPYLLEVGIYTRPIVCRTKQTVEKKYRGGVSNYFKIKDELIRLCRQHKNETLTTMFDYYGLPLNTPGLKDKTGSLFDRVARIEQAINDDIGMGNMFFNLTIHEFEGLLFSNTSQFSTITDEETIHKLQNIKESFQTPEYINDSKETAPSKRLESLIPGYAKVSNGTIISMRIGIDTILGECEHFNSWISKIRSFATLPSIPNKW